MGGGSDGLIYQETVKQSPRYAILKRRERNLLYYADKIEHRAQICTIEVGHMLDIVRTKVHNLSRLVCHNYLMINRKVVRNGKTVEPRQ